MRVLLDTNILIHREAATVVRRDIGKLFLWLDKLRSDKCVHPASLDEINKHRDEGVATTLAIVDGVYRQIKDEEQFISLCRKRSVFTDKELSEQWNYNRNSRPFIVVFLSAYSLPKRRISRS